MKVIQQSLFGGLPWMLYGIKQELQGFVWHLLGFTFGRLVVRFGMTSPQGVGPNLARKLILTLTYFS